jgi:hypothetical protein
MSVGDEKAFRDCALCEFGVFTLGNEHVYIDEGMASEAGLDDEGYAHRRCYESAAENEAERRGVAAFERALSGDTGGAMAQMVERQAEIQRTLK